MLNIIAHLDILLLTDIESAGIIQAWRSWLEEKQNAKDLISVCRCILHSLLLSMEEESG